MRGEMRGGSRAERRRAEQAGSADLPVAGTPAVAARRWRLDRLAASPLPPTTTHYHRLPPACMRHLSVAGWGSAWGSRQWLWPGRRFAARPAILLGGRRWAARPLCSPVGCLQWAGEGPAANCGLWAEPGAGEAGYPVRLCWGTPAACCELCDSEAERCGSRAAARRLAGLCARSPPLPTTPQSHCPARAPLTPARPRPRTSPARCSGRASSPSRLVPVAAHATPS
jgi:hypothetical protein